MLNLPPEPCLLQETERLERTEHLLKSLREQTTNQKHINPQYFYKIGEKKLRPIKERVIL